MNHEAALRRELATMPLPTRIHGLHPLFILVGQQYAERAGLDQQQTVGLVYDLVAEALDTVKGSWYLDRVVQCHFEQGTLGGRLRELVEASP